MARKQLGTAPLSTIDAATKGYVDSLLGSVGGETLIPQPVSGGYGLTPLETGNIYFIDCSISSASVPVYLPDITTVTEGETIVVVRVDTTSGAVVQVVPQPSDLWFNAESGVQLIGYGVVAVRKYDTKWTAVYGHIDVAQLLGVIGNALTNYATVEYVDDSIDAIDSATAVYTNKDLSSGTNIFPTFNQNTTGNAATATKLATARMIAGHSFDGTADITITKSDVGLSQVDNTSDSTKNGAAATLTNKTISGVDNSLTNIGNTSLVNSAITIAGTSVALGSSISRDTITGVSSNGLLKRTGANTLAAATAGTDYLTPSGTEVLTNKDLTSGTNTFPTFNQSTTGNAATATKLATARTINGVPFDGTANITISTSDATKEPIITAGTTGQYWRGDKTWQTLDKTAVGLSSVDNTSDATKNSATATLTNKTISLTDNTLSGTTAQFNTALSDNDFATQAGTETLINKTISGSSNALSNIGNAALTNSSITIAGTSVSLGSSITLDTITGLSSTGLIKRTGANTLAEAVAGTDYSTSSATETLTNKTLTNPTVTGYTETLFPIGTVTTSYTIVLTNGTVQSATLTASTTCTFTMPSAASGKSFTLLLKQAAATGLGAATFTGVKWPGNTAPTITPTAGTMDILVFTSDGTNWYGSFVQGYVP